MPTATVTSKGQITIPAEVRKALRLEPGTKINSFQARTGEYIFRPRTGSIRDLRGCLAGLTSPDDRGNERGDWRCGHRKLFRKRQARPG